MAYREDEDLVFLKDCDDEDLDVLVHILTRDKEGDERWTEELTVHERYKKHAPHHSRYWDLIAAELQCFGANSLVTIFRGGEGVLYKEVLRDVCAKRDTKYKEGESCGKIEQRLLMDIMKLAIENMNEDEREALGELFDEGWTDFTGPALAASLQTLVAANGFAAYQLSVIVANAVSNFLFGRGLSLAANAALTRSIAVFAGPVGLAITGLWTLIGIAGPAYRVTVPAVIQVAYLRLAQQHEQ